MEKFFFFAICLFMAPLSWADQPTPPVIPIPSGDEALPPPPLDQNLATPVVVPVLPGGDKTAAETAPATTQPALPPPPPATPTPVPVKAVTAVPEAKAADTPTPRAEAPAPQAVASGAPISAGSLTAYFPVQEGAQWTYEYLKPATGQTAKGTYSVKCASAKQMPNGTVRAVFETDENGQATQDHYSLYDNKIEHMTGDGQTTTGDFVFKVPAAGGAAWVLTEKDGTVHKSKAAFGQAQVYQKTYPDCVVVTEKVLKGGKAANTVIYYYAKGIGLVAIEVYSPKMKLVQDKSVALTKGPNAE